MPPDPDKRRLRELKRVLKKAGSKHRRRELKRDLTDNPDEAAHSEENLGRLRSDTMNGLDRDATRKKTKKLTTEGTENTEEDISESND